MCCRKKYANVMTSQRYYQQSCIHHALVRCKHTHTHTHTHAHTNTQSQKPNLLRDRQRHWAATAKLFDKKVPSCSCLGLAKTSKKKTSKKTLKNGKQAFQHKLVKTTFLFRWGPLAQELPMRPLRQSQYMWFCVCAGLHFFSQRNFKLASSANSGQTDKKY